MNPRRVVAFVLFLAVTASSVEVLIGIEGTIARSAEARTTVDTHSSTDQAPDAGDDCPCLCACMCSGAQLVVTATAVDVFLGDLALEAPEERTYPSSTRPSPRPPHRPPLA